MVGASSSRKTTVALNLAARLKQTGKRVDLVKEYARAYLERAHSVDHISEQSTLFLGQKEVEDQAAAHYEWVITDSAPFLSYVYACLLMEKHPQREAVDKGLETLHLLDRWCLAAARSYDRIYLLVPGEFVDDGVRTRHSEQERDAIYLGAKRYLDERALSYTLVSGDAAEKIAFVLHDLGLTPAAAAD